MTRKTSQKEIWWFEPRWSRKLGLKQATAFLIRWQFWVCGVLLPYLGFAALVWLASRAVPELQTERTNLLLCGPFPVLFMVGFMRYALAWAPQIVAINSKGIRYAGKWIVRNRIVELKLELVEAGRPCLWVEKEPVTRQAATNWMAKLVTIGPSRTSIRIGISPRISAHELLELLREEFPEVRISSSF